MSKDFTYFAEKGKEKIDDKDPVLVGYWVRKIFLPALVFKKGSAELQKSRLSFETFFIPFSFKPFCKVRLHQC